MSRLFGGGKKEQPLEAAGKKITSTEGCQGVNCFNPFMLENPLDFFFRLELSY